MDDGMRETGLILFGGGLGAISTQLFPLYPTSPASAVALCVAGILLIFADSLLELQRMLREKKE
jgi:hypothetical protein